MKRAVIIYNILVLSLFITAGLVTATTPHDIFLALLFAPPLIYFCRLLIGNLKLHSLALVKEEISTSSDQTQLSLSPADANLPTSTTNPQTSSTNEPLEPEIITDPDVADVNRRLFLKLIGGAGLSVFMMSLFTDRAHAAFFGSMPVPGAMTIKDSTGAAIDPAEKQPTDGYEISEIDDAATPAYYGFVHKTGAWYISREDANGSYRYVKGPSDFPTAWANRATLTYDYFDNVF